MRSMQSMNCHFCVSSSWRLNFLGRCQCSSHYLNRQSSNWKTNWNCQSYPMRNRYFPADLRQPPISPIPVPCPENVRIVTKYPIEWIFILTFKTRNHFRDNFGRPRTVLCHTIGKFVLLQKFCVTATVSSKLRTTCHHPPGTNTVSPGF